MSDQLAHISSIHDQTVDEITPVDGIYLDFSKAFNSVDEEAAGEDAVCGYRL